MPLIGDYTLGREQHIYIKYSSTIKDEQKITNKHINNYKNNVWLDTRMYYNNKIIYTIYDNITEYHTSYYIIIIYNI